MRRHPHGIILTPTRQELFGRIAQPRSVEDARRTAWQGRTPSATSVPRVPRRGRSCGTGLREPAGGGIRLRAGRGRRVGAPAAVRTFRAGRAVAGRPRAGYPSDALRCVCAARSDTRWRCVRDVWAVPEMAETVGRWVSSRLVSATPAPLTRPGPSGAPCAGSPQRSTSAHSASLATHSPVSSGVLGGDHTHPSESVLGVAHVLRGTAFAVRAVRRCPHHVHLTRNTHNDGTRHRQVHRHPSMQDAGANQAAIATRHNEAAPEAECCPVLRSPPTTCVQSRGVAARLSDRMVVAPGRPRRLRAPRTAPGPPQQCRTPPRAR